MRVYDRNANGVESANAGRVQEAHRVEPEAPGTVSSAKAGSADRVELSSALGILSRAVSDDSARRSARVEALGQLYASGRYQPDPAATARSMISEALHEKCPMSFS